MTLAARKLPLPASVPRSGLAIRRVHDVIVIGSQLGGVVAAALLAKRGLRVLHVDHDGVHDRYVDRGYLFPYGPEVLPPLRTLASAQAVLDELGLSTEVNRALTPYRELQVLLPEARLALEKDDAARSRELVRAFGNEGKNLDAQLKNYLGFEESSQHLFSKSAASLFLPNTWFERRATARFSRRNADLFKSPFAESNHPLTQAMGFLFELGSYQDAAPPAFAFGHTAVPLFRAPHRFPAGREGLAAVIRATIPQRGGDLLGDRSRPALVEELIVERGAVTGVKLIGAAAPHHARVVIAGTDIAAVRRLVMPSRRQRKLSALADLIRTRRLLFTMNFIVAERAIPPGLSELAIARIATSTDPTATEPTAEHRMMLLQIGAAYGDSGVVPKERTVTVSTFVPASVRDLGEEAIRATGASVRTAVEDVLPFFDQHLKLESTAYLAPTGSRGSRLLPHPLLEVALPRKLQVEGIPVRSPLKRLLFASREVLPGLGLEGELMTGQRAAKLAAEICGKIDPLK